MRFEQNCVLKLPPSPILGLKAFPVNNSWARFVIFLLGDPHLLEGGQGGQDGSSDPDGVLPLGRSDDLDLHGGGSESSHLLLHPVGNARVHGGASRQHSVGVQVLTDVDVTLHDAVVCGFVDTSVFHTYTDQGKITTTVQVFHHQL